MKNAEQPTLTEMEAWPVPVQQAYARGDVTLQEIRESVTRPIGEVCPHCARYAVPPELERIGICKSCYSKRAEEAYRESLRNSENARTLDALKKAVQRSREDLGINPRRNRDHLRSVAVDMLRTLLSAGPLEVRTINAAATLIGVPNAALQEAKLAEGIELVRDGAAHLWRYPQDQPAGQD